jgi:hypothetical protein
MTDLCSFCGGELPLGTKRRNYCKDACRQAAYRNRKPQPPQSYPKHRVTAPALSPGLFLRPYVYPEPVTDPRIGSNPDGSTPGALQGDDYPLTFDADGNVELPACLDRRKPKLAEVAA